MRVDRRRPADSDLLADRGIGELGLGQHDYEARVSPITSRGEDMPLIVAIILLPEPVRSGSGFAEGYFSDVCARSLRTLPASFRLVRSNRSVTSG